MAFRSGFKAISRHYSSLSLTQTRPLSTTNAYMKPALHNNAILSILDRTILSPERAESTCSGTDNAVGNDIHAYDPSTTAPETEFQAFEAESRGFGEVDPLFISPANRDFSQVLDRDLDGRAVVRDKGDRLGGEGSVRGWVKKGRAVRVIVKGDEFERLLRGLRRVQRVDGTGKAQNG